MARRRFEIDIHVKSLKIGQRNLQDFHFDDGKSDRKFIDSIYMVPVDFRTFKETNRVYLVGK